MSFTEEQVKAIIQICREEMARVFQAGMHFTGEADAQMEQAKPVFKPASAAIVKPAAKAEELQFNPDICNWENAEGARGPFQVCKAGTNFSMLLSYLNGKEGKKATLGGMFYWVMTDGNAVGRKQVGGH